MNILFKKTLLAALAAVLALAALPVASAFAQGTTPPKPPPSNEQLEKAWAHQTKLTGNLGKVFEDAADRIAKAQQLIDKAKAGGKDVSNIQAALDAFAAAVEKSRPIYDSIKAIVSAHAGFDANGKVTDATQAQETVQAFRAKAQALKTSMDGTGRALRDAIRAFRQANRPTATPTQQG